MSALSTGIDLIEIERLQRVIDRHGRHFLERVFTTQELTEVGGNTASLAARFAAKEAVAKTLGTGIGLVTWHEIEILRQPDCAPELHLHGAADRLAEALGLETWSISLSHTHTHAIAMVVAMGSHGTVII